jgi:DNA repair protein RecO (recombination protein O)
MSLMMKTLILTSRLVVPACLHRLGSRRAMPCLVGATHYAGWMPGLYKDQGVVLSTIKLGEADRILTIFTRDHGKVRAVAKGVRKTKSRWGGRLEPFTRVDLLMYRGRNLDTITSADVVEAHAGLRTDYMKLTSAAALAEVVDKISPDRERASSIYDLLLAGLGAIHEGKGTSVVPAFLVKLLSISGFHPSLQVCAGCGDNRGLEAFSPAMGGAICLSCWEEDESAMRLGADRLLLLAQMLTFDFTSSDDHEAVVDITNSLRRYAEYHLERPLRSLQLLAL